MSDAPITHTDKAIVNQEVSTKLRGDTDAPKEIGPTHTQAGNDTHLQAGTLPSVTIDGVDSKNTHWGSGTLAVASDLLSGAGHQLIEHPGQVAESFGIGLATGVLAAPVAEGTPAPVDAPATAAPAAPATAGTTLATDATTGTPGNSYGIIAEKSFGQTYQPVKVK